MSRNKIYNIRFFRSNNMWLLHTSIWLEIKQVFVVRFKKKMLEIKVGIKYLRKRSMTRLELKVDVVNEIRRKLYYELRKSHILYVKKLTKYFLYKVWVCHQNRQFPQCLFLRITDYVLITSLCLENIYNEASMLCAISVIYAILHKLQFCFQDD